jgi:hypothetical protein
VSLVRSALCVSRVCVCLQVFCGVYQNNSVQAVHKQDESWDARLENRNKSIKIQNTNNQKLKNICHV